MSDQPATPNNDASGQAPSTPTPTPGTAGGGSAPGDSAAGTGRDIDNEDIASQMATDALDAMQSAISDVAAHVEATTEPQAFTLPSFDEDGNEMTSAAHGIELLSDVDLHVKIELGRTRMLVEDVLRLGAGSVVELDKLAGDPVDVYVNERLIARGEVLVLNDNFCIRVNEVIDATPSAHGGNTTASNSPSGSTNATGSASRGGAAA